MKVALVHDFIKEYGGAERVLEALHEIYPEAPVYTAWCDLESLGPHKEGFKNWDIRVSWAKNLPFFGKLISPFRIFAPLFFESFNFDEYDLVISSSSPYFGKGIITKPETVHISYCHTPPRFLYGYKTAIDWKKHWWANILGSIANHWLRIYDFWSAQRVDHFVANSNEVARRIKKFYRRESTVIYPPVDIEHFGRKTTKAKRPTQKSALDTGRLLSSGYYLVVSRLARSKRVDLAIEAAKRLNLSLKIIGAGRDKQELRKLASEETTKSVIEFMGEVNDQELIEAYQNCQAVVFCAEDEDFGIVPVEAMAVGKPVIALASGGTLETIIEHVTGEFFAKPTVESLVAVLEHFEPEKYRPADCQKQAAKFSKENFKQKIREFVESKYDHLKPEVQLAS